MPRETNYYTCEFCDKYYGTFNIKSVLRHEKGCEYSPENKTCKSCVNEVTYLLSPTGKRYCKLLPNDQIQELLDVAFRKSTNVTTPAKNCVHWKGT